MRRVNELISREAHKNHYALDIFQGTRSLLFGQVWHARQILLDSREGRGLNNVRNNNTRVPRCDIGVL